MKKSTLLLLVLLSPLLNARDYTLSRDEGLRPREVSKEKFASKDNLKGLDSFYDQDVDYAVFSGRVSDRDKTSNLLKISTENINAKFFRAGDKVLFNVAKYRDKKKCVGFVRGSEKNYFTLYTDDLDPCWGKDLYFRRGTVLIFNSLDLSKRVEEASLYRVVLMRRKKDFFNQLNGVNHFIWSYEQERVKVAADYDRRILEIEKEKKKALSSLIGKRKDYIRLQRELVFQLDELDKDLDFYRIERPELYVDRWHMDQDTGTPVAKRPQ